MTADPDDLLDGCVIGTANPTPAEHLPYLALFAVALAEPPVIRAEAIEAKAAEWRALFGRLR